MNPGTDWIDQARRVLDALHAGTATAEDASAEGHSAECRWCPVCQVAAVVRGERPELTAALADVLTATATALRTFAEAAHPDAQARAEAESEADSDAGEAATAGTTPPRVQRIDIA
jgi:hypothetical protein